jgi:ATP-dependent helicase/DNAse subunit B
MTNPLLFKFEGEKQVIQLNNSPGFMYLTSTRFEGLLFSFLQEIKKKAKTTKKSNFFIILSV